MKFITAKDVAEKWGISDRRVQLLCKQGRIEGAYRFGWTWAIPEDADKPIDARYRSNKINATENEGKSIDRKKSI